MPNSPVWRVVLFPPGAEVGKSVRDDYFCVRVVPPFADYVSELTPVPADAYYAEKEQALKQAQKLAQELGVELMNMSGG